MEDKARAAAVSILYDMEINKSYSNIKSNEYFIKYDLNSVDRGFATEILYGTIRWKLRLDYVIQKNIKTKISDLSIWVLVCLRTALYQIFFMDKVPEFAAVNEAVRLTKTKEERASALVNGVLRNILRNKNEFNDIGIKNKTKRLSIEYSHPEWFIKKLVPLYGEEFVIDLMKTNNTPPELSARVNTLKIDRSTLINKLEEEGHSAEKGNLDESIILKGYSMIEKSELFQNGFFLFQDESSMLVSKVLDPKPHDIVFDLCSAPGGKTTHIAQLMSNEGEIRAFDIHEHKLRLIEDNARKLGINIIKAERADAAAFRVDLKESCDKILVDAPCSGLGLIRKKPEIRWNINENDIINLKELQIRILTNASKYLKKGGVLVYSTCTISKEENDEVVQGFLKDNPDFKLDKINNYLPEYYRNPNTEAGYIKLFPNINKCDGFFIARIIKEW